MSEINKAQETKIALLVEAIEGLLSACIAAPGFAIDDARKELHDRLREFLLPAIRIIDGGRQTSYTNNDIVTCLKCGEKRQCLDYGIGGCSDWAASIKARYGAEESDSGGSVA